nr:hypothetical protein [Morchella crassipes]
MQPPPPLIALLKDFSLNFLKKNEKEKEGRAKRGGAAAGSCMATPPPHLPPPLIASVPPCVRKGGGCIPPPQLASPMGGRFAPPHHVRVAPPTNPPPMNPLPNPPPLIIDERVSREGGIHQGGLCGGEPVGRGDASRALRARTHWRSQWRGGASPPDPPPPPPLPLPRTMRIVGGEGGLVSPPPTTLVEGGGREQGGDARGRCAPPSVCYLYGVKIERWGPICRGGNCAGGGLPSCLVFSSSLRAATEKKKKQQIQRFHYIQYIEIYWTNETCCVGRRGQQLLLRDGLPACFASGGGSLYPPPFYILSHICTQQARRKIVHPTPPHGCEGAARIPKSPWVEATTG